MREIGYDKPLFVQPFDHRGSFKKKFFGIKGQWEVSPQADQYTPIVETKTLVYRGLLRAIEMGVPKEHVGVLVDSEYGAHVQAHAKLHDIPVACCIEKSGQEVFDFEYGPRWQDHLRLVGPDIVKVLVRHHTADDAGNNREQMVRLQQVSDYLHATADQRFMFELLVPAVTAEDKAAGARYDTELRWRRMIDSIQELQGFGIEPDIWKIEGLESPDQAREVAEVCRAGDSADGRSRAKVGCILLGRGSDAAQVHAWLRTAAAVPGWIGFAVGRTNFAEPVKAFLADRSKEAEAVETIAANYKQCVDVWTGAAG